ncbi:MAG: type VI secretion system lipoprotein TssJ [Acidisphaera sp.]|nr:type VI secretion system lipoprotein TssJ [Acidisphaera sp.]
MIRRRSLLLVPAALVLTRCAAPPPPPAVLELAISAGPDINPNVAGKPAAVAVRLFQLNATAKFERADVFALTERERATLGDDTAGSEEFVLSPGENRTITRELKKGVQFIGIAVLFRDIDHAKWRAMAPVAASGPSKLTLKLAGITATLASA